MTKMTLEQVRDWHRVVASENAERRALCSPNGERWELWNDEFNKQVAMADAIDAHLAKVAQEWQPIETAPRDGLPRLYLCNGKVIQGFVDATGSLCKQDELGWLPMRKNPTHWMPLPAAPMLSQRGECEHAWVDATNSRVSGTALCTKCGKLDSLSNHPELQP